MNWIHSSCCGQYGGSHLDDFYDPVDLFPDLDRLLPPLKSPLFAFHGFLLCIKNVGYIPFDISIGGRAHASFQDGIVFRCQGALFLIRAECFVCELPEILFRLINCRCARSHWLMWRGRCQRFCGGTSAFRLYD